MKRDKLTEFNFSESLFVKRLTLGFLLDVLNKLRGFIFLPFFTRMLGPEGFGTYGLIITTGALLAGILSLNIGSACAIYTTHLKEQDLIRRNYYSAFYSGLGFAVIAGGVVLLIGLGILSADLVLFLALFLLVAYSSIGRNLTVMLPHMFQRTKFVAVANFLSDFGAAIFSLFLVFIGLGPYGAVLGLAIINALTAVVVFAFIVRSIGFTMHVDFGVVRRFLKFSLPLIPYSVSGFLIEATDKYFLWFFWGAATVGIYQVAIGAASIVLVVSTTLYFTFTFSVIKLWEENKEMFYRLTENVFKWVTIALILLIAALFTGNHIAVALLGGAEYYAAGNIIPIYGVGICAIVYNSIFVSLLSLTRDTRYLMLVFLASAAVNVLINYALVPTFGLVGAAVATSISWIMVSVLLMLKCRKIFDLRFDFSMYARLFSIGIGLFAIILVVKSVVPINLLNMVLLGLVVFGVYIITMLLTGVISRQELSGIIRNLVSR